MVILNKKLIAEQKLVQSEIDNIMRLHYALQEVFDLMEEMDPSDGQYVVDQLHRMALVVESIEYNLQRVWKFPQDKTRHTWWNRAPHCICKATAKGFEMVGFKGCVVNNKCPVHGEIE